MSQESDIADMTSLPVVELMAERLLDAATAGRFTEELAAATELLERHRDAVGADELVRYRVLFFDLAIVSTADRRVRAGAGVELLAVADDAGWQAILHSSRIDELQQLTDEPEYGLELIELLSYAPEAGIRDFAIAELEAAGIRAIAAGQTTRSIERLLHAAGAREQAYRVESARKQRNAHPVPSTRGRSNGALPYRTVAIAGGHAQLRNAAASVLEPYGVETVSIPSSREAVRRERAILHALQGCDLAIVLVGQITHSTSDQVRKAADRLGIPVMFTRAASAVAIERQLLDRERRSRQQGVGRGS